MKRWGVFTVLFATEYYRLKISMTSNFTITWNLLTNVQEKSTRINRLNKSLTITAKLNMSFIKSCKFQFCRKF